MRFKREDIPVIVSILLGGLVALIEFLSPVVRGLLVISIFGLGWYGRKKIKDKVMKSISELANDVKDNIGIADMSRFRELMPSEVVPLVDILEKLVEMLQEREIQRIEYETLIEQGKELQSMREEINKYKSEMEKMRTKIQCLQVLHEITSKAITNLDVDSLSELIGQAIVEKFDVGNFAIMLREGDFLEVKAAWGFSGNIKNVRFSLNEGVSGLAFTTGQVIYIPDTRRDGRYLHWKGEYAEEGSFLSIPIKYRDEVIGLFNFNRPKIGGFSEEEINLLKRVADYAAVAIKNAYLFEEVKNLYSSDPMTGLVNRTTMIKKVEELISKNRDIFSFVLFDVDNLRQINMNFGYTFGDKIIIGISRVILSEIRAVDVASRFGGDEFAVVLIGANAKKAEEDMKKISEKISTMYGDVRVSVSGGISEFPKDGVTVREIFESSDRRLLAAKRMGGGVILSYQKEG